MMADKLSAPMVQLRAVMVEAAGLRRLEAGNPVVCLAPTDDGRWYAVDDTCTHEDCSLSDGDLDDHTVECPCHGSRFDLIPGAALNLPAVLAVRVHQVEVKGREVVVTVDEA